MELARITGQEDVLPERETRKDKAEAALMTMWDNEFGLFLNKNPQDGSLAAEQYCQADKKPHC